MSLVFSFSTSCRWLNVEVALRVNPNRTNILRANTQVCPYIEIIMKEGNLSQATFLLTHKLNLTTYVNAILNARSFYIDIYPCIVLG